MEINLNIHDLVQTKLDMGIAEVAFVHSVE